MAKPEISQLEIWVGERGAEMLDPTNEWEVLRFRGSNGVGVVYTNRKGKLTYNSVARAALSNMRAREPWDGTPRESRGKRTDQLIHSLRTRDGGECFYCGEEMDHGQETIEHILSLVHGGKHHIANMALAHERCNQQAANLTVVEKVCLREDMRAGQ